jgi:hypothetical protein
MDDDSTGAPIRSEDEKPHDHDRTLFTGIANGIHEAHIEPAPIEQENDNIFQAGGPINGVTGPSNSYNADGAQNLHVSRVA